MLNNLRSSGSNAFVWVILVLLIIGLAGFGIGGSGGGGATTPVASVGDASVTVDEYARALNQENRRLSAQVGRNLTVEEMRLFGLDAQVLSQLLNGAALDGEAARLGLSVGDETVLARLMATNAFRGIDGTFDTEAYNFALEGTGLSASEYDDIVRQETTRQLLQTSVMAGVRTPRTAAEAVVAYLGQQRAIEWVRLNAAHLDTAVGAPNETQLQEHYDANPAIYTLPETRTVTYAAITEAALADTGAVTAEEVQAIYDERIDEYRTPARRLLDRIVFGTAQEAEAALARITEGGAGFDDIAADRGLAPGDTDLGEVRAEDMNAAELDQVFAATELGVVGPVASDLGPALYRINAILDETVVTFEEVRTDLANDLALERAADEIADALEDIEDLVAGGATLEELANESLLELGTATVTAQSDDGIAADVAFREEVFAAAAGQERDPISLSDGIAVVRVDAVTEPTLQPLADVRAQVTEDWRLAETGRQVAALGAVLKDRVDAGEALADIATTYNLILTEETPLGRNGIIEDTPPAFLAAAFESELGAAFSVPDGPTVLLGRLTEIVPEDMTSEDVERPLALFSQDLDSSTANDVFAYFTQGLQEAAGVSVNQSLIANIQSQLSHN